MELTFFIIAFLAEVIGTIAGFGSSTIALPLTLFFLDFPTALVLVACLHICGNLARIHFFRYGLDKNIIIKFGLVSVVFTILGAILVSYTPIIWLKGLLGLFLVIYTLVFWSGKFFLKSSNNWVVLTGGGLSGFLAGLIGTGGALRAAFLNVFGLPKEKYIATAAAIALAVDLTRLPIYLKQGFLAEKFYWYIPFILVIAIAGSYTGKLIVKHIQPWLFRRLILIFLFLIGTKFIMDWINLAVF